MKRKKEILEENYFFVDEAGDPTFYDKHGNLIVGEGGCSQILLLGFIRTTSPEILRQEILALHSEVINDPYLQNIPSMKKTAVAFHAKDDVPEVREKVFKKIKQLDFKAEFVIARKIEKIFRNQYKANENSFYDDLIVTLFKNKLHLARKNTIYFSTRGNKLRQKPLEDAIQQAITSFERKWNKKVNGENCIYPQTPLGEPCLQIADYLNWAVQRAFLKGEDRFYKYLEDKVSFLCDIFDFNNYPKNYYNQKNKFNLTKISPL